MSRIIVGVVLCLTLSLLAGGAYYLILRSRSRGGSPALPWRGAIVFALGVLIATLGVTANWLSAGRLHSVAYVTCLWGGGFMGAAIVMTYIKLPPK